MTQKHHITYKPEWTVELTGWEHIVRVALAKKWLWDNESSSIQCSMVLMVTKQDSGL